MRQVVWSDAAKSDYLEVLRYIAADDPEATDRVAMAFQTTGDNLAHFATGHPGRVSGTYEKSVRGVPYVVAYALADGDAAVAILRVIHMASDWREEAWPEGR